MRATPTMLIGILLAPAFSEAQHLPIRPGQYEYTIDMDFGIPKEAPKAVLDAAGFKNQKTLECLTAADLKGDLAELFAREADDLVCTASEIKPSGNRLLFTTRCKDDGIEFSMKTEMTFAIDAFTVVSQGKDATGRMNTTKLSAKRVGECPKE